MGSLEATRHLTDPELRPSVGVVTDLRTWNEDNECDPDEEIVCDRCGGEGARVDLAASEEAAVLLCSRCARVVAHALLLAAEEAGPGALQMGRCAP